ncbi:MAG: zinc ribbon domain-containing protein [Candidatus Altiarchaeota archaeon]|nr:zinc ribbon domain-containing protein [Candidatus Altiarchaeota archaeon]
MGIFDNVANRVKSDMEYKASGGIVKGIEGGIKDRTKKGDKCPSCKKPVEPGLKFCSNCGAKLTVTCPKCSKEYPVGTKFCSSCGSTL